MRYLTILLLGLLMLLLLAPIYTIAHTITWPDGQTFTFAPSCCNGPDCAAIPLSAIKEVKGGYQVD